MEGGKRRGAQKIKEVQGTWFGVFNACQDLLIHKGGNLRNGYQGGFLLPWLKIKEDRQ